MPANGKLNKSGVRLGLSRRAPVKKLHEQTTSRPGNYENLLDVDMSILNNVDLCNIENLEANENKAGTSGKRKLSEAHNSYAKKKPRTSSDPEITSNRSNTNNIFKRHASTDSRTDQISQELKIDLKREKTPERDLDHIEDFVCDTPPQQTEKRLSKSRYSQLKNKSSTISPISKPKIADTQAQVPAAENLWDETEISSQRFIEELAKLPCGNSQVTKSFVETKNFTVTTNEETYSQYLELNRSAFNDSFNDLFKGFSQTEEAGPDIEKAESESVDNTLIENINWEEGEFSILAKMNSKNELETEKQLSTLSKSISKTSFKEDSLFVRIEKAREQRVPATPMRPVSSELFCELGQFYGLPIKVKSLIKEYKTIDNLYDWQDDCLKLKAIRQRNNLVYALPTSGGKSLVAEILMMREVLCRKKNVLLVLPFVALVQEKIADLTPFALELGYLVEEYAAGKGTIPPIKRRSKNTIYISTIEKSLILLDSLLEENRALEIGLIVVDELHMIGDESRGCTLETLLSKVLFSLGNNIQIIGMSATIANALEIASFLRADTYSKEFRPVELKEYVKYGKELMEVKSDRKVLKDAFVFHKMLEFSYDDDMLKRDPDHIGVLVMEVIPHESCLIFCPTKKNCENVALLLCNNILPEYLKDHKTDEKRELMTAIHNDSGLSDVLRKTIPFGVAYHHSGLTSEERKHLEEAFRLKIISVLCCTSTLAAGVNLPAKRVIIRSPYTGNQFLTLSRYKQMIGRAGRAGHSSTGESILICPAGQNAKIAKLFCSSMDEVVSGFLSNKSNTSVKTLILNIIENSIASTIWQIEEFFKSTLMYVQCDKFNVNLFDCIVDSVKSLLFDGAIVLQMKSPEENLEIEEDYVEITLKDDTKHKLKFDEKLGVNKLGKAAVKAGISLEKAHKLYSHLCASQKRFDLSNYLNLLYLVTPTEENIKPDYSSYHRFYLKLEPDLLETAKTIGISEINAMQMISNPNFKGTKKQLIETFYVTLMLHDLWCLQEINTVAQKFRVERGTVQKLMQSAASNSATILRFCEELEEFWAFKELLTTFTKRLAYCCTSELVPLMELQGVRIGRAKLLYQAGYKTVQDIANATSADLVKNVANISYKVAKGMIQSAKLSLVDQIDMFKEKVHEMLKIVGK